MLTLLKKWIKQLNIIDYLLLGILLFSLVGISIKIFSTSGGMDQTRFQLTFVCKTAPSEILAHAPQEGFCTDAENNISLGKLTSLQRSEEPRVLRFTTELKSSESEHGILTGGKQYVIGQNLTVNLGGIQLPVYIADIQTISNS